MKLAAILLPLWAAAVIMHLRAKVLAERRYIKREKLRQVALNDAYYEAIRGTMMHQQISRMPTYWTRDS